MSDFACDNPEQWLAALAAAFPAGIPETSSWHLVREMAAVLQAFCRPNLNHVLLPGGGGMDMLACGPGKLADTIELSSDPCIAYICQPTRLTFEYLPSAPWESFFLLESEGLQPFTSALQEGRTREEAVELPDGRLLERSCWEPGTYRPSPDADDVPLPASARRVKRFFRGKFLVVAKSSWWNSVPEAYDDLQAPHSAAQIRARIEAVVGR